MFKTFSLRFVIVVLYRLSTLPLCSTLSTCLINIRLHITLSLQRVVSHYRGFIPHAFRRSLQLFHYHFNAGPAVFGLQVVTAVTTMTLLHRSDETYLQPQVITVANLI